MQKKNIILLFSFIIVYIIKYITIEKFSVNVPFGDQWDGEAFNLYKPYIENKLTFLDLLKQHNEHRIFFTRILNLVIFIFNNHIWDTILIMKIQAIIFSLIPCILLNYYLKFNKNYSIFTIIITLIIFSLPIGYENLLWGFQSQFYFMICFSLISFNIASSNKITFVTLLVLIFLSIFSYLNIASGFTVSINLGFTFLLKYFNKKNIKYIYISFLFFILGFILYRLIVPVPGHTYLRSQNLHAFLITLLNLMMWPLVDSYLMIFLWWIPIVYILGFTIYYYKSIKLKNFFLLAIIFWILLQSAGISYARGGNIHNSMQNRYTEIYLLIGISILYFIENFKISLKFKYLYFLYRVIILSIFFQYSHSQLKYFKNDSINKQRMLSELNHLYYQKKINYKNAYMVCINSEVYKYPYPFNDRLWIFINDKTINKILPITIVSK